MWPRLVSSCCNLTGMERDEHEESGSGNERNCVRFLGVVHLQWTVRVLLLSVWNDWLQFLSLVEVAVSFFNSLFIYISHVIPLPSPPPTIRLLPYPPTHPLTHASAPWHSPTLGHGAYTGPRGSLPLMSDKAIFYICSWSHGWVPFSNPLISGLHALVTLVQRIPPQPPICSLGWP